MHGEDETNVTIHTSTILPPRWWRDPPAVWVGPKLRTKNTGIVAILARHQSWFCGTRFCGAKTLLTILELTYVAAVCMWILGVFQNQIFLSSQQTGRRVSPKFGFHAYRQKSWHWDHCFLEHLLLLLLLLLFWQVACWWCFVASEPLDIDFSDLVRKKKGWDLRRPCWKVIWWLWWESMSDNDT